MNTFDEDRIVLPRMAANALRKAKEREMEKLAKGYRYVEISPKTKILVECGKDGNPTLYGYSHIARYKEKMGVKFKIV